MFDRPSVDDLTRAVGDMARAFRRVLPGALPESPALAKIEAGLVALLERDVALAEKVRREARITEEVASLLARYPDDESRRLADVQKLVRTQAIAIIEAAASVAAATKDA